MVQGIVGTMSCHQEKGQLLLLEHNILSEVFVNVTSFPRYIDSYTFYVLFIILRALCYGVYHCHLGIKMGQIIADIRPSLKGLKTTWVIHIYESRHLISVPYPNRNS